MDEVGGTRLSAAAGAAIGLWVGMMDYYTHSHEGRDDWYRNDEPLKEEGYATDLIVNDAVRVIGEQPKDKPLFLYVSFNAVHTPYQAPPDYLGRYADKGLTPERQMMAAMLSSVDDGIGRIVEALEKAGMRENTILIFSSDNGGQRGGEEGEAFRAEPRSLALHPRRRPLARGGAQGRRALRPHGEALGGLPD